MLRKSQNFIIALALIVICGLLLLSCGDKTESEPAIAIAPGVDSVASVDGNMIYYEVTGEGSPPLVFVHCWNGNRSYWDAQVKEFSKDHLVVTLDLAGHGQSGRNREKWNMPNYGADVAAVVNKLDLKNAVLIGHSMGGTVIIEAARQLPGKLQALISVDSYNNLGVPADFDRMQGFFDQFRKDYRKTATQFAFSLFKPDADSSIITRVAADFSVSPQEIAVASLEEALKYNFSQTITSVLQSVNLPVWCIDADTKPSDAANGRQFAPSFIVKVVPGVGHFIMLEDPEGFNKALHECLDELSEFSWDN